MARALTEASFMRPTPARLLHWTPRILGILFAAFVSAFALDVFSEGYTFRQTIVALAMHLIPTAVVLSALAVSWRWAWAGGLLFLAAGVWYLIGTWGRFHWSAYAVIAGPLLLLGLLFEIDWWYARLRKRQGQAIDPNPSF
jgi:hypothetical protein